MQCPARHVGISLRRGCGPHRRLPDLGRRGRIASAKCAIEIGKVTEPHIKRHRANVAIGKAWVAQDPVCAREALAEHERREGEAFVLKELVNVTWSHAVASCHFGDRQIAIAEIRADVGHDSSQPRGGDAASLRNRSAAARGADGCGNEIMHVADGEPLQLRSSEWQSVGNRARIGDEQVQRLRAVRNETERRVVEPAKERCDLPRAAPGSQ